MVDEGINSRGTYAEAVIKHSCRIRQREKKQKFFISSLSPLHLPPFFLFHHCPAYESEMKIVFRTQKGDSNRFLFQYLIANADQAHKCCFPVQLTKGLWIKNLCALFLLFVSVCLSRQWTNRQQSGRELLCRVKKVVTGLRKVRGWCHVSWLKGLS